MSSVMACNDHRHLGHRWKGRERHRIVRRSSTPEVVTVRWRRDLIRRRATSRRYDVPTPAVAASGRERRPIAMADLMEAVTSLAKRRGIAFQSGEIYGGLRSS